MKSKKEKKKTLPPSAGPNLAQPAPRPRFPLSHGPSGPAACARATPDRSAPLVSDSPSLPLASLSLWQPEPVCQLRCPAHASPARSPPTASRPIASPLRLAPASATTPPLYPSRPFTPRLPEPSQSSFAPFPPSWRARRRSPSPPSLSLSRAPIKGAARAPLPSTPAPATSSASPQANRASAAALPRRSGEPRSSLPSEFRSN